jgi:hypothetical protein
LNDGYRTLANFTSIIEVKDLSVARVLVTALKAHGFHPLEGGEAGLPGMPGILGARGVIAVQVPEAEAADARLLAEALVAEMDQ